MNRLARLILASGAGLTLALTASPALAAPPSDSRSNPARVEHVESSFPEGSSSEFRGATRYVANEYYTTNTRDQGTLVDNDGHVSLFDKKTHYMLNRAPKVQVTKMNSQNTTTENGATCRTNSQFVMTKDETPHAKGAYDLPLAI